MGEGAEHLRAWPEIFRSESATCVILMLYRSNFEGGIAKIQHTFEEKKRAIDIIHGVIFSYNLSHIKATLL